MTLNEIRDEAFATAEKSGFHENLNFGEKIALIHSELSEALEADRKKSWAKKIISRLGDVWNGEGSMAPFEVERYERYVRGSVEEEIADALIRLFDLAGIYEIDLDWHVAAKMAYNKTRSKKHGKEY